MMPGWRDFDLAFSCVCIVHEPHDKSSTAAFTCSGENEAGDRGGWSRSN